MTIWIACWLLTLHFVADFVCQSDWMAQGKSKRWEPLTIHVGLYTAVMLLAPVTSRATGPTVLLWLGVTFAAHWLTDFVTSRINSRLWADKKVHWFFVGIGADQLIHAWTLLWTWQWLFGN